MNVENYNTARVLSEIKGTLDRTALALYDNDAKFDMEKVRLLEGYNERQNEVISEFTTKIAKLNRDSGDLLELIDTMVNEMEIFDSELCLVDAAYKARRRRKVKIEVDRELMESENKEDFYNEIVRLREEAKTIAEKCARSTHVRVIQEVGMLLSSKRMKDYGRLCEIISTASLLRDYAFYTVPRDIEDQRDFLRSSQDIEVERISDVVAGWVIDNEDDHIDSYNQIVTSAIDAIECLLTEKDYQRILNWRNNFKSIANNALINIVEIGSFEVKLDYLEDFDEVVALLETHLGFCYSNARIKLPALIDLSQNTNMFFISDEPHSSKEVIHSVLFSLLSNAPAELQKLYLISPEVGTEGFQSFLPLISNEITRDKIIVGKVATQREDIKKKLDTLNEYIDMVSQGKFVQYESIFDYNLRAIETKEALRTICILDFPKYFNEIYMLEMLYNIVRNGWKYGVNVIIEYNEKHDEHNDRNKEQIKRIMDECNIIRKENEGWSFNTLVQTQFYNSPAQTDIERLKESLSLQINSNKEKAISIERINPREGWFEGSTQKKISIPIGKNELGEIQFFEVGNDVSDGISHYAMVVGSTGSGKSTLLHTLVLNAITTYSPDEINLYILDFKNGTEFKRYGEKRIPHIKVLGLDAMQEYGKSVLDELWEIMTERSRIFKGKLVNDISEYRQKTGENLPRILVVMDEFQVLFNEDTNRKVAADCGNRMAEFISLARVYGIHFILSTQTMSRLRTGYSLPKATIAEMHVRIGLKCTGVEAELVFGDRNGRMAEDKMKTEEKGRAAYTENDLIGNIIGLKVAYAANSIKDKILSEVETQFINFPVRVPTRVFDASEVPRLSECKQYNSIEKDSNNEQVVYLGEAIRIGDPVAITFTRKKRSNILISGSGLLMDRLVSTYLENVLKHGSTVYLINGAQIIEEPIEEGMGCLLEFGEALIKNAQNNEDILKIIDSVYDVFASRNSNPESVRGTKTTHLIINNFQWMEILKRILENKNIDEYITVEKNDADGSDIFGYLGKHTKRDKTAIVDKTVDSALDALISLGGTEKKSTSEEISYTKKMLTLIEKGYMYNINIVLTCSGYVDLKDYKYTILDKFPNRILFSMNDQDADRIISDVKTSSLKDNMAVYTDGIRDPIQFKPFIIDENIEQKQEV